MKKKLTVTKQDVAKIIGQWWRDYEADPESFEGGADTDGNDSADKFFQYAEKLGVGK